MGTLGFPLFCAKRISSETTTSSSRAGPEKFRYQDDFLLDDSECRVLKSTPYGKISIQSRGSPKSAGTSRRSKSPVSASPVNGTPGSQLSTPGSVNSPCPSPSSPRNLTRCKEKDRVFL
ncbi:hypothetical protein SKAU_G00325140 [Synaphobranchus kaupii]|uniref:Uncharacterized protein n=1 Tax=Synaphobranchus kaupii TaxID=118154 RepID=A0A9Q1IK64_SYNKA|nr:hypothetical protein SKAU_G00325140 [Synaphobranchus kaupii]